MIENDKLVLVTGATGSIGSALVRRLSKTGIRVRALARNPNRAAAIRELNRVEIFNGDLLHPESLRGCVQDCSLVVHCAAKLAGTDLTAFRDINVTGTRALLEEAIRSGVERFVHVSTIGVYGFSEAEGIREDFPWSDCRLPPYFATKQEAERAAWAAAGQLPLTIARLGDIFGPEQFTWTVDYVQRYTHSLMLPPTHSSSGTMNPSYIDNTINALLLLASHPAAPGQAFNVVDGTPLSFSHYFRWLAAMTGKHVFGAPPFLLKGGAALLMLVDRMRGREPAQAPETVNYILRRATISNAKIRERLGWLPVVSLEEGLRRTEEWLRREGYLGR